MENFIFNSNNVCLNPEIVFEFGNYKEGQIRITVAYHSESGKWCSASDWQTSNEGRSSGCCLSGDNFDTKEEAIQKEVERLTKCMNKLPAKVQTAFNRFRVSSGKIEKGDQLTLF